LKISGANTFELSGSVGEIISITENSIVVACGNGSLEITEVQREGGRVMEVKNFLNGCPLELGAILGSV
jgi:methionyl-tRNA formyltransferase